MSVEERYYRLNRILLKSLGLWPYQDSKWVHVQTAMMTIMYLSAIFVQLAVFVTHECTMDILVKVFSFIFPSVFMMFFYYLYYLKSDVMKKIVESMYYDWKSFKDKSELDIMDVYANLAKQFTEVFLFFLCIAIITTMMCHIVPITLDIVSPINVTRAEDLHLMVEYFVDQSKYCYVLILHLTTFVSLGLTTVISIGVTFYGYALHACALFKVTNYRIKIILEESVLQISSPEREYVIHDRLVCAVHIHRRAILHCRMLTRSLQKSFLFLIIIGVVSLSINLFRFLKAITVFEEVIEILVPSLLIFFHFSFMFFGNHIGQQITNTNDEVFNVICSLPWYAASVNIQKLLLFLLQKCSKNVYLGIGGIYDTSYESFTALSKLSISYFTVLYAVQ